MLLFESSADSQVRLILQCGFPYSGSLPDSTNNCHVARIMRSGD